MANPVKILIINAYSAKNRGDAGIIVAMIALLRRLFPDCEIGVMSSYHQENAQFYKNYGANSIPAVWQIKQSRSRVLRYLDGLFALGRAILNPTSASHDAYRSADLVCSAGGGYLYSSRQGPLGIGFLNVLFHYWLGTIFKKTVIGFPQSVGPIRYSPDKYLAKLVLSKVSHIFSRDDESSRTLNALKISNYSESADIAFDLNIQVGNQDFAGNPKVGITVLDWRFSDSEAGVKELDDYKFKIVEIIRKIIYDHPNCYIYLFPQVDVEGTDSDVQISKTITETVNSNRCIFYSLRDLERPEEIAGVYSRMDCFVGSRMHSTIFALAAGVPTIGLAYQPKTKGTFRKFNIEQFSFEIKSFKSEDVLSAVESCLKGNQRDIRPDISSWTQKVESIVRALAAKR